MRLFNDLKKLLFSNFLQKNHKSSPPTQPLSEKPKKNNNRSYKKTQTPNGSNPCILANRLAMQLHSRLQIFDSCFVLDKVIHIVLASNQPSLDGRDIIMFEFVPINTIFDRLIDPNVFFHLVNFAGVIVT
jgi:hypothetical protein